jgi:hypothetical protein
LHLTTEDESSVPESLVRSAATPLQAFLCEFEQDWRGHWRGVGHNEYAASWQSISGTEVTALLAQTGDGFTRTKSSDGNDGVYRVTASLDIDSERSISLVAGLRTLQSGVPGAWRAVWWRRLRVPSPPADAHPVHV